MNDGKHGKSLGGHPNPDPFTTSSYLFPPERVVRTNYATRDMRQVCEKLRAAAVFVRSTEIDALIEWLNTFTERRTLTNGPLRVL